MIKQAWSWIICLLFPLLGHAQPQVPDFPGASSVLVYKITDNEAHRLCRKSHAKIHDKYLHTRIDSLSGAEARRKQFPHGHYIYCWVERHLEIRKVYSFHSLQLTVVDHPQKLQVRVTDRKGEEVEQAEVKFAGRKLRYDPGRKLYVGKGHRRRGNLSARLGPQEIIVRAYSTYFRDAPRFLQAMGRPFARLGRGIHLLAQRDLKGYLAMSQPIYRPGDTLRVKAFAVNPRGKPIRRPLEFTIWSKRLSNVHHKELVTPVRPGVFLLALALADSLPIDQQYEVMVRRPTKSRRPNGLRAGFKLEDYLLDEAFFTLRTERENYGAADSVRIVLAAQDANGLPLADVRAGLRLHPEIIFRFTRSRHFLPDTLWTQQVDLGESGTAEITLPATLFQGIDGYYNLQADFRSGSNEIESQEVSFSVDARSEKPLWLRLVDGHLEGSGPAGSAQLYRFFQGDTLGRETVRLPFRKLPDTRADHYWLFTDRQSQRLNLTMQSPVEVSAEIRRDSVQFLLRNPGGIPGHYTLLRGREVLLSGESQQFQQQFPIRLHGKAKYIFQFHYPWAGRMHTEATGTSLDRQKLYLDLEMPDRVQPGETRQLRVQVRNASGQKAVGADLTTAAISSKFRRNGAPALPSFSQTDPITRSSRKRNYALYAPPLQRGKIAHTEDRYRYGLQNSEWFLSRFPPDGWHSRSLPTPDSVTQFAPFFAVNGDNQGCNLIKVDGKIVYYQPEFRPEQYAIPISPGFHHLQLFNANYQVEVENVYFPAGQKQEIFIDVAQPGPQVRVRALTSGLPLDELDELNAKILWLLDYDHEGVSLLGQGDQRALVQGKGKWVQAGIFEPGPVWMLTEESLDTTWIDFEPGTAYMFTDGYMLRRTPGEALYVDQLKNATYFPEGTFFWPAATYSALFRMQRLAFPKFTDNPRQADVRLKLRMQPFRDFAFFLLVDQASQVGRIYASDKEVSLGLPKGEYRLLACDREGKYREFPSLDLRRSGTYLRMFADTQAAIIPAPVNAFTDADGRPLYLDLYAAQHVMPESGGVQVTILEGGSGRPDTKIALRTTPYSAREGYAGTDDSGQVAIPLKKAGWYALEIEPDRGVTQTYTQPFYWQPGMHLDLVVPYRPRHTGLPGSHFSAYRSPVSFDFRFPIPLLRGRKYKQLPPRRGTRTHYSSDLETSDGEEFSVRNFREAEEKPELPAEPGPGGLREDFADIAWWETNLVTDENGEAFFQATFPDDLSQWNAWVAVMNDKRQSGRAYQRIRAYRDLVATLSLPRFLLAGDSSQVQGTLVNHSPEPIAVTTSFALNDSVRQRGSFDLRKQADETLTVTGQQDTLHLRYALQRENGYTDGEARPIPVLPRGRVLKTGGCLLLARDSTFSIVPDPALGPVQLFATARPLDVFLETIESLEAYPYACMEQTASRLLALLGRKRIQNALSLKFRQEGDIRKLIRRLESAQHARGSWGWWYESTPNLFMTAYVCQALQSAASQGFNSPALEKGKAFLASNLPTQVSADNLVLLRIAAELGLPLNYAARLQPYSMLKATLYDQLQLIRIRQRAGLPYDASVLLSARKRSLTGGTYWGTSSLDLHHNDVQATLLAYRIFSQAPNGARQLAGIRRYFLERSQGGLGRNTLEAASVLETLLPFYLSQPYRSSESTALRIKSGAQQARINQFPSQKTIPSSTAPIYVRKSGPAPLYLSWYQTFRDPAPKAKTDLFVTRSHFEQNGRVVSAPESGQALTMVVTVDAQSAGTYLMLEIPIPAGCAYGDKSLGRHPMEVHREYFKEKVAIFLQELPAGQHEFRIDLEPRFPGHYALNPIHIEPMYFPTLSGNSRMRDVRLK